MRANRGFTLIELVVGMVIFSIVMLIVVNLMSAQSARSVDPVLQSRASELGQSIISEIMSKAFDERSSRTGNALRCNELTPCTASGNLGPDNTEVRGTFNDVDDYHGLIASGETIQSSLGQNIVSPDGAMYQGFRVAVQVFYDDNLDGINDDIAGSATVVGNVKLLRVTVTTPLDEDIVFTAHRWNF
ncbi:type IV pilus modification PilV family protein [Alteromonas sp. H39]|uniref:type IV pilus modification PilV family protein n=1 Tax=Alteromonas sp. H39 TaxID=3389876 RepID=UPI0039E04DAA